jgi:hypothetical protein
MLIQKPRLRSGFQRSFFPLILLLVTGEGPAPGGPLPLMAPAVTPKFVGSPAAKPFVRENTGVLTQTLFSGTGPNGINIAIREILIPPQQSFNISAVKGAVLVEWLEGHATIAAGGGSPHELGPGIQLVGNGQQASINNPSTSPLIVRVYGFTGS